MSGGHKQPGSRCAYVARSQDPNLHSVLPIKFYLLSTAEFGLAAALPIAQKQQPQAIKKSPECLADIADWQNYIMPKR
jgi:hypothetical protein